MIDRDDYIILSVPWRIRLVPAEDPRLDCCYGKYTPYNHTIYLAQESPRTERTETLLHETIHAIVGGRDKCDLTKEDTLRWFSQMLADTLLRNGIIS